MRLERGLKVRHQELKLVKRQTRQIQELRGAGLQRDETILKEGLSVVG